MTDDTFTIETGVPIPPARSAPERFPWTEMSPGDSFYIECANSGDINRQQNSATMDARNKGYRIATRRDKHGLRVWMLGKREG